MYFFCRSLFFFLLCLPHQHGISLKHLIVLRAMRPLKNSIPGYGWFKRFNIKVFPYRPFILNIFQQRWSRMQREKWLLWTNDKQTNIAIAALKSWLLFFLHSNTYYVEKKKMWSFVREKPFRISFTSAFYCT